MSAAQTPSMVEEAEAWRTMPDDIYADAVNGRKTAEEAIAASLARGRARKTGAERANINARVTFTSTRGRRLMLDALMRLQEDGRRIERATLEAFAREEHARGFGAGQADAMGEREP